MSIWFTIKLIFFFIYLGLSALITYLIYKEETPFYTPIFVTKKSKKEGEKDETVNIHDEFDEFCKRDKPIKVFRLFLSVLTIFWLKFIIDISLAAFLGLNLYNFSKKKNFKLSKEEIDYILSKTRFLTKIFLKCAGAFVDFKRLPDEKILPIYKKYFGPDYKIDYDGKFSCYISNHTCIYDMALAMAYLGCGFVAKEAIKKVPIFGKMNIGLHSILVDRGSTGAKKDVLEEMLDRQKALMEGKPVIPFMIFPEGTTTAGRHLLTFKKGAFNALLPIKPTILHPNLNNQYHIGVGSTDVGINYLRSLCEFYFKLEYIELPIMTPNEFMYTNFSSYGKEKWEIYSEVSREIMCEIGNFKKSNFGIKDSYRYCTCIDKKILLDRESYKIE